MQSALTAVARALSALGSPGMLIGGFAAAAHGVPRLTRDIDVTVSGRGLDLDHLLRVLEESGIRARIEDAVAFAREHQVLLVRHGASGVDVDVTIAWLPFEEQALRSAERIDVGGVELPVVRPEDLIIYKLVAWRPQDQQDVERLLERFAAKVDLTRIRGVLEEFAIVLDAHDRLAEFDRLVERVVGR
jgi:predicted nucleotidyltransferase